MVTLDRFLGGGRPVCRQIAEWTKALFEPLYDLEPRQAM
jgi:hypothetical protein